MEVCPPTAAVTAAPPERRRRRAARPVAVLALALLAGGASPAPPGSATASPAAPAVRRTLTPPAAAGALAFQLAPGRAGTLLLTWLEPVGGTGGSGAKHRLRLSRLRDGRWSPATTVVESATMFVNWADVPAVAETSGGELVATWLEKLGAGTYAYGVALASSRDDGRSWQRRGWLHADRSESEHGFVSLLAQGDAVRAVWLDGHATAAGGGMALRTALVRGGVTSEERQLDPRVCDCCSTALAASGDALLVAFRDRSDREVRDHTVLRVAGGAVAPARLAADGWVIPGCPVNGPMLVAEGQRAALAWFTGAAERPRVLAALSSDGGRSFGAPLLIDGASPWGRVGAALLPGGEVAVCWLAGGEQRAPVRLARVSARGVGPPLTVATTGAARASGVPRLQRLGAALYVAWRDDAGGRLQVEVVPVASLPPAP